MLVHLVIAECEKLFEEHNLKISIKSHCVEYDSVASINHQYENCHRLS